MNKSPKVTLLVIAVFLIVSFFIVSSKKETQTAQLNTTIVQINEAKITVEIARDIDSRALGLSGKEYLSEGEGMMFVFDFPARHNFWMKEMNFPIDIIWLDEEKKIIHIEHELSPDSYPDSFGPDEDSLYVLEVVSGFAKKQGLSVGDITYFNL